MKELAAPHADAEISWLDGVSVDYPDWHFNVRPSNTEPLLRLNLESLVSREDMERKRDEVLGSSGRERLLQLQLAAGLPRCLPAASCQLMAEPPARRGARARRARRDPAPPDSRPLSPSGGSTAT